MTTTDERTFIRGDRVRWDALPGSACYVKRNETEWRYPDAEWIEDDNYEDGGYWLEPHEDAAERVETGNLIVVMVGDDYEWSAEPGDLAPLEDDDYCAGCGQIGCGWC